MKIKDRELFEGRSLRDLLVFNVATTKYPKTIQECHNQLVWIKKTIPTLIDEYMRFKSDLREYKENARELISKKVLTDEEASKLDSLLIFIEGIANLLEFQESFVDHYHKKLSYICDMYSKHDLSLHDFCSLIGVNYKTAIKNIKDIDDDDDNRFYNYIFKGIEDARIDEDFMYNPNGMPLHSLVTKFVIIQIHKDKGLHEKVDEFLMHELGLAEHMMIEKFDEDGNKYLDKHYPKLKAIK